MSLTPERRTRRDRHVGYACAAALVLVWAGFSLMSRWSARAGPGVRLTPWDLGALRFGCALLIAAPMWCAGVGRGLPWRRGLALGALAGLGFALPSFVGFGYAPAAHGALILSGTLPFLVAVGAWIAFGDRWTRGRLVSLALLLLGLLLFGTEAYVHQRAPPGAWRGDLLFLFGAASWAGYTVLIRRWSPSPAQSIVAVGLWCGGAFMPVWALLLPSHLREAPWREVAGQAAFQGLVAIVLSLWLFTRALRALGASRLTTITALVPGTAAVLAVPLLDEPLGPLSIAGLVVVGIAVAARMGRATAGLPAGS